MINNYKDFVKCGLEKHCLIDSIEGALKLNYLKNKIVMYMTNFKMVPTELLKLFLKTYKEFSKNFFSKKTVDCLKTNCKFKKTSLKKQFEQTKKTILKIQKNIPTKKNNVVKNYVKVLDTMQKIIIHLSDKFEKKY